VLPTVVFDLDKVLLGGDASALFLRGRLRQAPRRAVLLLLAAPLLAALAAVPRTRALGARITTRLAVGGRPQSDVAAVASAYRTALTRHPEAAIGAAVAAVRKHRADGERVVVATGCEETLARGFLEAIGLGELAVVGSIGRLWPPAVRRAMGESKVAMLTELGYPRPGSPSTATASPTCRCPPARRSRCWSTPTSGRRSGWRGCWAARRRR
jgi:phosphatidylglycerophosphatase C